jgi:thermitase
VHRGLGRIALYLAGTLVTVGLWPGSSFGSNDSSFEKQWALSRIGAPEAWKRTTGARVRVGLVDTGVDLTHEDLAGRIVESTSCVNSHGDPKLCVGSAQDDFGHGTHVAGIVAAEKDNGVGVAGVAPGAELVVAKAFDGATANAQDVIAGIKWVVDHGAKVVNLSLGDALFVIAATFGSGLVEGVDYAWAHGAVPVVAAGNDNLFGLGTGSNEYGDLNALVVGATGKDDQQAGYSSPTGNAKWALLAPGGSGQGDETNDIYSTYWRDKETNQYGYLSGTSMAAPQVTGAVALLLAQGYSQQQAVDRILATVDHGVPCGPDSPNCKGRLNVAAATGAR